MNARVCSAALLLTALVGGGCNLFGPPAEEGDFNAPDPSSKLYAISRAGQSRDSTKIPQLIECLDDDDPAVRFLAIGALQTITNQTLDYDYGAPEPERAKAQQRWRVWAVERNIQSKASLPLSPDAP